MILYNASSSYYSMIARLALLEAGVVFENRRMDIHIAKEQFSPSYLAINPAMTVPTLTDGNRSWTDSRDILTFAADAAKDKWLDSDDICSPKIERIVKAHYAISIERFTFGKIPFLAKWILRFIIKKLEAGISTSKNRAATQAKIDLNRDRLAYFTEGNRADKLQLQRDIVQKFLQELPAPGLFLFGEKPSSADIVTTVLLGRLQMINEYALVPEPLARWFERMQARTAYKEADIWTHFQPWRILLKR